jgi:hypothetical protein
MSAAAFEAAQRVIDAAEALAGITDTRQIQPILDASLAGVIDAERAALAAGTDEAQAAFNLAYDTGEATLAEAKQIILIAQRDAAEADAAAWKREARRGGGRRSASGLHCSIPLPGPFNFRIF